MGWPPTGLTGRAPRSPRPIATLLLVLAGAGALLAIPRCSGAATVCSAADLGCPAPPATCVVSVTRDVGHLCVLDFGDRDVEIRGTLQAEQRSGSFDVLARNVTLNGGRLRSPGDLDEAGGDISVVADGTFTMTGTSPQIDTGGGGGGGIIDVEANRVSILAGNVLADGGTGEEHCGDGGAISIVASEGPFVLDGNAVTVKSNTGGFFCSGADVYIEGTSVELKKGIDISGGAPGQIEILATNGDIVLTSSSGLSAHARGSFEDSGNDAGRILMTAEGGDVIVQGPLSAEGSGGTGAGGDIAVVALDGSITVEDPIDVKAPGPNAWAGGIDLDGALDVQVRARLSANAGGQSRGGDVRVASHRGITFAPGFTTSVDGGGLDGGAISVIARSAVTIGGELLARGANGGDGGQIDVRGCRVTVSGKLDASASGNGIAEQIFVEAAAIDILAAADLDATPCTSGDCTHFRLKSGVPSVLPGASILPLPILELAPGMSPCCGNAQVDDGSGGTLDADETCDDGNLHFCDGCSPSCALEPTPSCPDDHNECTQDCDPQRGCQTTPLSGTTCASDSNACTGDVCVSGACSHPPLVCQDGVACTTNQCNPATGCVFTPNDAACNDGESCTTEHCDASAGCVYTNLTNGTACDDGSLCTLNDSCQDGACTGPPPSCDDGNGCTKDTCRPGAGCVNLEDSAACGCTDQAGSPLPSGAACVDGNTCTAGDTCDGAGHCRPGAVCPDDGDPCSIDLCFQGLCGHVDLGCAGSGACTDGEPCSDGDVCTQGICEAGSCVSQPISCGDGDACTGTELCIANLGCRQTSYPSANDPACPGTLDAFACYGIKASPGASDVFAPLPSVPIEDELGQLSVGVRRAQDLCLPADVNEASPGAPTHAEHLEGYQIKAVPGSPKFQKVSRLEVTNQLGTITVDAKKPQSLLVPTARGDGAPPDPLPAPRPDSFLCYAVSPSKGTPKFAPIPALAIQDAFGPRVVDVKKPSLLCNPANLAGANPSAPDHIEHLLCYRIAPSKGAPKFFPRLGLFLANSFGREEVDAKKSLELCLPSTVTQR